MVKIALHNYKGQVLEQYNKDIRQYNRAGDPISIPFKVYCKQMLAFKASWRTVHFWVRSRGCCHKNAEFKCLPTEDTIINCINTFLKI